MPIKSSGVEGQKWDTSGYHCGHRRARNKSVFRRRLKQMYLVNNVGEAGGEVDREHNENDIAFWVAQWPQSVVFFLAGGIPQRQFDEFRVVLYECNIVLEHCWNICLQAMI